MRRIYDDSQANLIEMLAREHRTVEGLLDDLQFLDGSHVDDQCDLYLVLQSYGQMSKAALVEALTSR